MTEPKFLLDEDQRGIPAQPRATGRSALPHTQALPQEDQQSKSGQTARAASCHQPQTLSQQQAYACSSPLYAGSEGEDGDSEPSAGMVAQDRQQQRAQGSMPKHATSGQAGGVHGTKALDAAVTAQRQAGRQNQAQVLQPTTRQTRASCGQASRAGKPTTDKGQGNAQGKAQGRSKPTGPAKAPKGNRGKKHTAPVDEDDLEGFGLLSAENPLQPVRQPNVAQPKPDNKAEVQSGSTSPASAQD